MSRQRIDWAHHRETWINRNLNGATYALKQQARDEDLSYGVLTRKAREQGWRQQLEVRCAELRDRVSEEVRERTAVDQVEARLEHARLADLIEPVLRLALAGVADRVRDDPGAIALRDVVALGRLWTKLLEVGAGLPRVHDGVVQEVPEAVAANRRQMQELEGAVMELARWKRDKRAKEPSPADASGNLGESEP